MPKWTIHKATCILSLTTKQHYCLCINYMYLMLHPTSHLEINHLSIKALSHGHLDAHPMRIKCEPDRIHLLRWFGCAFKQDRTIHDSHKVMPTMRLLARLAILVGLAYGTCLLLLSILLLQQRWGRYI